MECREGSVNKELVDHGIVEGKGRRLNKGSILDHGIVEGKGGKILIKS